MTDTGVTGLGDPRVWERLIVQIAERIADGVVGEAGPRLDGAAEKSLERQARLLGDAAEYVRAALNPLLTGLTQQAAATEATLKSVAAREAELGATLERVESGIELATTEAVRRISAAVKDREIDLARLASSEGAVTARWALETLDRVEVALSVAQRDLEGRLVELMHAHEALLGSIRRKPASLALRAVGAGGTLDSFEREARLGLEACRTTLDRVEALTAEIARLRGDGRKGGARDAPDRESARPRDDRSPTRRRPV